MLPTRTITSNFDSEYNEYKKNKYKGIKTTFNELVTNAITSIYKRGIKNGEIHIIINKEGMDSLQSISIRDNGLGFTEENRNSFSILKNSDVKYKDILLNHGLGRLSYIAGFESFTIKSCIENQEVCLRNITENNFHNNINNWEITEQNNEDRYTQVKLLNPKEKKKEDIDFFSSLEKLQEFIIRNFLLKLQKIKKLTIEFIVQDADGRISDHSSGSLILDPQNIYNSAKTTILSPNGFIIINEKNLDTDSEVLVQKLSEYKVTLLKLEEKYLSKNQVQFIHKSTPILTGDRYDILKMNIFNDSSHYILQIENDDIDKYINTHNKIPEKEVLSNLGGKILQKINKDYFREIHNKQQEKFKDNNYKVRLYSKFFKINNDYSEHDIEKKFDNEIKSYSDNLLTITQNIINYTSEELKKKLKEVELSRSLLLSLDVVYKKAVLTAMKFSLEKGQSEDAFHDLICKKGSVHIDNTELNNNLWIFDSRFSNFSVLGSAKSSTNISQKKPDLIFGMADLKKDGISGLVIIELKAPSISASNKENPTIQVQGYFEEILRDKQLSFTNMKNKRISIPIDINRTIFYGVIVDGSENISHPDSRRVYQSSYNLQPLYGSDDQTIIGFSGAKNAEVYKDINSQPIIPEDIIKTVFYSVYQKDFLYTDAMARYRYLFDIIGI